jgi:hypothetical protein
LDLFNKGKKGETLAVNALGAYKGNRGIAQFNFLTSAVDRGEWLTSRPGRFKPGRDSRYPLKRRLGWPQRRSGHFRREEDLLPVPEIEPRTVQLHRLRYPAAVLFLMLIVTEHKFHDVACMEYDEVCRMAVTHTQGWKASEFLSDRFNVYEFCA